MESTDEDHSEHEQDFDNEQEDPQGAGNPARVYLPRRLLTYDGSPKLFRQRFRIPVQLAQYLVQRLEPLLAHRTKRNKALSTQEQVLSFLHLGASNNLYHNIRDIHGPSPPTVCRIMRRVSEAICSLEGELLHFPGNPQAEARKFQDVAGIPGIIGVIDGTHIRCTPPSTDEDAYINRHHHPSINVTVVAGPDYKIYFARVSCPGSWHDARVLRTSQLWTTFEEQGALPFPNAILLGDSAYPLRPWLITPVLGQEEDPHVRHFNRAHKRTRSIVERSIGILKSRFRILQAGFRLRDMEVTARAIKALIIIHNLCIVNQDNGHDMQEEDNDEGDGQNNDGEPQDHDDQPANERPNAQRRNELIQMF